MYSFSDVRTYDEEWDETAKVKKREREESEPEEGGVEEIEIDMPERGRIE